MSRCAELDETLSKEGKAHTKQDVNFRRRQDLLLSLKAMISEFRSYNVFRSVFCYDLRCFSYFVPFAFFLSMTCSVQLGCATAHALSS